MDQRGKRTFRECGGREAKGRECPQKERLTNCVKCEVKYEEKKVSSRFVIRSSLVTFVREFFSSDGHGDWTAVVERWGQLSVSALNSATFHFSI